METRNRKEGQMIQDKYQEPWFNSILAAIALVTLVLVLFT